MLIEVLSDWYHVLAVAEATIDDDSVAATVTRWAAEPPDEPRPRGVGYTEIRREFAQGYLVTINDRSPSGEQDLRASHWHRLRTVLAGSAGPAEVTKAAGDLVADLRGLLRRSRRRALDRDADGTYRAVLEQYVKQLRSYRSVEDQMAYQRLEQTIGKTLHDERYLLLATEPRLRRLYLQVSNEMSSLYNWWMDLARGGVQRAR